PRDGRGVARSRAPDRDSAHRAVRPFAAIGYATTRFTVATTFSTVKPKNLKSGAAGADSPKRSIPMIAARPSSVAPTYLCQPPVALASTATRGTPAVSTLAR